AVEDDGVVSLRGDPEDDVGENTRISRAERGVDGRGLYVAPAVGVVGAKSALIARMAAGTHAAGEALQDREAVAVFLDRSERDRQRRPFERFDLDALAVLALDEFEACRVKLLGRQAVAF